MTKHPNQKTYIDNSPPTFEEGFAAGLQHARSIFLECADALGDD